MSERRWLLHAVEQVPTTWNELKRMLGPHARTTRMIKYDALRDYHTLQQVFGGSHSVVVFMELLGSHTQNKIGHWIVLLDFDTHIEHFDSYGLLVDQELAITHERPFLSHLVRDSRKRVVQTTAKLQTFKDDVNTCGRWVVCRIRQRDLQAEEFARFYTSFHEAPDVMVAFATLFL